LRFRGLEKDLNCTKLDGCLDTFFYDTNKTDRVESVDENLEIGRKDLIVLEAKMLEGVTW